jgi:hypothetical protein
MLTETRRRVLAAACNEEWYEKEIHTVEGFEGHHWRPAINLTNRTFTSAADWELVREKVVMPNLHKFVKYVWAGRIDVEGWQNDAFAWFLTLSIEERCELVAKFCIYMHEQGAEGFEFAKEFVGKEEVCQ